MVAVAAGCASAASCKLPNGIPALIVTVVSASGTPVCDVTVLAVEGSYSALLSERQQPSGCTYAGPFDRAGTYTVTVMTPSKTVTRKGVTPKKDVCDVITLPVTITM